MKSSTRSSARLNTIINPIIGIANKSKKLCHLISILQIFPFQDFFGNFDGDDTNIYFQAIKYLSEPANICPIKRGTQVHNMFPKKEL